MEGRRYTLSFAELCDRLSIVVQKVVYAETEEMRDAFAQERDDIIHDLNLFLNEGVEVDGQMISHLCYLQLINATIWNNESALRGDGDGSNLKFTHGLNSNRASVKKAISEKANGRIDPKLNYGLGIWNLKL